MADITEFHDAQIADATIGDLMSQLTVFCYCGGELGRAVSDGAGVCRLVRRCGQCDTVHELDVKINNPSAGELTVLLRERESASATTP